MPSREERDRAVIAARNGDFVTSLNIFNDLLKKYPDNQAILGDYVTVLTWKGDFNMAEKVAEKLDVTVQPEYVLSAAVNAIRKSGQPYDTVFFAESALKHYPESITINAAYSMALTDLDRLNQSAAVLGKFPGSTERDIVSARDYLNARRTRTERENAVILAREGKYNQAMQIFDDMLGRYPANQALLYDYIVVSTWAGEYKKAADASQGIDLNSAPDYVVAASAESLRKSGRLNDAYEVYKLGYSKYPDNPSIAIGYAMNTAEVKHPNDGQDILREFVKRNPRASGKEVAAADQYIIILGARGNTTVRSYGDPNIQIIFENQKVLEAYPGNEEAEKNIALALTSLDGPLMGRSISAGIPRVLTEEEKDEIAVRYYHKLVGWAQQAEYGDPQRRAYLDESIKGFDSLLTDPSCGISEQCVEKVRAFRIVALAELRRNDEAIAEYEDLKTRFEQRRIADDNATLSGDNATPGKPSENAAADNSSANSKQAFEVNERGTADNVSPAGQMQKSELPASAAEPVVPVFIATVTSATLNLRAGPSLQTAVVTGLRQGDRLTVKEDSEFWARVETDSGLEGWISKNYVTIEAVAASEAKIDTDKEQPSENNVAQTRPEEAVAAQAPVLQTGLTQMPREVLFSVAQAYSNAHKPAQAQEIYLLIIKDPATEQDVLLNAHEGLFWAYLDNYDYDKALDEAEYFKQRYYIDVHDCRSSLISTMLPQGFSYDEAGTADILVGQGYLNAGELKCADTYFRNIIEKAPGNANALGNLAALQDMEGLPFTALDTVNLALTADEYDRYNGVRKIDFYMSSRQWERAETLLKDLEEKLPGYPALIPVRHRWNVHDSYELQLFANTVFSDTTSGVDSVYTQDPSFNAYFYTRPFLYNWRAFVGFRYASGDFPEGTARQYNYTLGVDYRAANFEADLSGNVDTTWDTRGGGELNATVHFDDHWHMPFGVSYNASDMTLRAIFNEVNATNAYWGMQYYHDDSRQAYFNTSYTHFSDPNNRYELSGGYSEKFFTWHTQTLTAYLDGYAGWNTSNETSPYFAPEQMLSLDARLEYNGLIWANYWLAFAHRANVAAGVVDQKNYGTYGTYGAGYYQNWNYVDRLILDYGYEFVSPVYDGVRELNHNLFVNLTLRF